MSDLSKVASDWAPWIGALADALGVDARLVDVDFIHSLSQVVAHEFERPMAPVAAYVLGLAAARHPERSLEELRAAIVGAIPRSAS